MLSFASPRATFFVRCSKGTYVRTLCSDIGDALGCGAHLEQLRRTRCGDFNVEEALPFDTIMNMDLAGLAGKIVGLHKLGARLMTAVDRSGQDAKGSMDS